MQMRFPLVTFQSTHVSPQFQRTIRFNDHKKWNRNLKKTLTPHIGICRIRQLFWQKRKVSWWMLFFLNAIFVFIQSLISFGWKVASDTKALIEFAVCSSKVHIVIAEGDRREMPVPLNRDIGVKEVVEGTKKGVNLEYGIEERGSKTILVVCVIGKLLTVRSCDLWHHEMQERGIFWIIEVCWPKSAQ